MSKLVYKESLPCGLTILSGQSGSGKSIFLKQYAYETLVDNGKVLWITTEELPFSLRTSMSQFGWNVERFEGEDKLQILDALSVARLGLSQNVSNGILGSDPEGMLLVISAQMRQAANSNNSEKFLVLIDSVSRLLLSCETKIVLDFVSCLNSRIENYRCKGIVTITEGVHDEKTLNAISFSCAGTFRFRSMESEENRIKQLRIETLRGRNHDRRWRDFTITDTGLNVEI